MLMHLHVKNFALIEEADMEFGEGLNILTGETGAGKSILIDAVNLALGGKAGANVIRAGAEYAYVELVFQIEGEEKCIGVNSRGAALARNFAKQENCIIKHICDVDSRAMMVPNAVLWWYRFMRYSGTDSPILSS